MEITVRIEDSLYAEAIKVYGSEEGVINFITSEWIRITTNNLIREAQQANEAALAAQIEAIQANIANAVAEFQAEPATVESIAEPTE